MAADELKTYRTKRDFSRTPEPEGAPGKRPAGQGLQFIVQKHVASHLHYDLRLEVGGVMKSWAVPKGPSVNPSVRRLAIEVEDHPMEYNSFEGTIPKGQYGGGTVMLWDRGTYAPEKVEGDDPEQVLARAHRRGKIQFSLDGERLQGSFALIRTRRGDEQGGKPQWVLIKQEDRHADRDAEITDEVTTSVATGRTMEEISRGMGGRRVWQSNRSPKPKLKVPRTTSPATSPPSASAPSPMLATSSREVPQGDRWTFEPKYDGIRVIAYATPEQVSLVTRNGHNKAMQFPEVAEAVRQLARRLRTSLVLDGELVGVREGRVARFESLQARMHLRQKLQIARSSQAEPAALVAFDLLLWGDEVWMHEPWTERREALEGLLNGRESDGVLLAESSADCEEMIRRARRGGWEGVIAKRTESKYQAGKRSPDWRKVKIEHQQEFIVGGWTEPRKSRAHLGALLLGYYDEQGRLVYAGHTGTGFSRESLAEMHRKLSRLERKTSPFAEEPATNEPAHWVTPKTVVEVRFNEWTSSGKLRQPVFLGLREDRDPSTVVREAPASPERAEPAPARVAVGKSQEGGKGEQPSPAQDPFNAPILRQLGTLEAEGRDGVLSLGDTRLEVTNLRKLFFPQSGHSKGDLLRYYVTMSELILPWMQDRPLVLKRFPDGIDGKSFYQQAAPADAPESVRVERVRAEGHTPKRRLIGGDLATLLYTVQLGAVSYDPWHSRIGQLQSADYTIIDLDPGPHTPFEAVVEVARWVKEEMDALGLHGALKTSGSSGLHIYLPLPPATPLDAATLVAQIVATRVAQKHPKLATIERMTRKRPGGTVYVDYLQNILGKTVSGVYAARAKPGATVSTPLAWKELDDGLDFRQFTLATVPARVGQLGDLWAPGMSRPNRLDRLTGGKGGRE